MIYSLQNSLKQEIINILINLKESFICKNDRNLLKENSKQKENLERKFIIVMAATLIINIMTILFSLHSNSISLISDAIHGLFDVILMLGCYISVRISKKKATNEYTYGYHRLESVVSISINIVFLCLLFMCVLQSLIRINLKLFNPAIYDEEINLNTKYMITSSSISIVGDIIIIYLMKTKREIQSFYTSFSRCC